MASTDHILQGKYPAKAHARRVAKYIESKHGKHEGVIYLEAQKSRMNEDNDQEAPFRQRRFFYYLTGCELPDSYVIYDIGRDKITLFIPPINPEEVVWSGLPVSAEQALSKYDVDDVKSSEEVKAILASDHVSKKFMWAIENQISDAALFEILDQSDKILLKEAIEECRVIKDEYEIAMIRKANEVSAKAHDAVMRSVKNARNESELEGIFLCNCIAHGCRQQAYSSIVASGTSAATLHYVLNNAPLTSSKLNLLLDAGGEYNCYAADITRTFPINGRFTPQSASIYSLVLKMQESCMSITKAGVVWDDVHMHAHKVAIDGLLEIGILKGTPEEILKAKVSAVFFPHGLGHYLGMDTHDTGGHPNYADDDPLYRYLRVRGPIPAGSVITVEPGIYFCKFIIEPALTNPEHAKFIDEEILDRYWAVGGVRIEDNILVTETGFENLTTVPKAIEEMEKIINS